jgi:hypothetical protein
MTRDRDIGDYQRMSQTFFFLQTQKRFIYLNIF